MRMDRLTTKFQMALADAQSLAVGRDHQFIEPAHLMVALLDQDGGSVRSLLTRSGANANTLRSRLGEILDGFSRVEGTAGDVQISADLGRATHWARAPPWALGHLDQQGLHQLHPKGPLLTPAPPLPPPADPPGPPIPSLSSSNGQTGLTGSAWTHGPSLFRVPVGENPPA